MSSGPKGPNASNGVPHEKTYFEQQRETLVAEIALAFNSVLDNISKLNRSLESVIAVGDEFGSVEALWSQFENVMAREPEAEGEGDGDGAEGGQKEAVG